MTLGLTVVPSTELSFWTATISSYRPRAIFSQCGALKTLGFVLSDWITSWRTIADQAPDDTYLLSGHPRFLGYVPQNFRVYGGSIASGQAAFLSEIEKHVFSDVVSVLRRIDPKQAPSNMTHTKLGEVKHLGTLVQASQRQGLPVWQVDAG